MLPVFQCFFRQCFFQIESNSRGLPLTVRSNTVEDCGPGPSSAGNDTLLSDQDDEVNVEKVDCCTPTICKCSCCTNLDVPYQPSDLEQSKAHCGQQSRSIQTSWYAKYTWISVCTSTYKVYCYACQCAKNQNLINLSKICQSAFIEGRFSNWKNALQ